MDLGEWPIIDITPVIGEELAVWPGDRPFRRREVLDSGDGRHLLLSSVHTTLHLGAHADAPNHYHPDGQGMAQRKLHRYLGSCQVVEVTAARGERIFPQQIREEIAAKRVLLKTGSFPDPRQFNRDFNALSPELVDFLAAQGVVLVGLDTPSVDLFDDRELLSHGAIYRHDMAVLEGVVLRDVAVGFYQLIALPLPIEEGDASPVRAVLLRGRPERPPGDTGGGG